MTFKKGETVIILNLHETTDGEGVYMNRVSSTSSKLAEQMILIIDDSRLVKYDSYVEQQRKLWYERN